MGANFTVQFKFDDGWTNVTLKTRVKEFFRESFLYNKLKPTGDICKFKLKYDQNIISKLLLATYDIQAQVLKDSQPYFRGIVSPSYKMKSKARVEWVDVTLEDNGYILENKISSDIQKSSIYLCNSDVVTAWTDAGTNGSLLHNILFNAGYESFVMPSSIHAYSSGTTHIQLNYFTHLVEAPPSGNDALSKIPYGGSYKELLTNLLFQYGYTYYFNESGQIQLFSFMNTNISPGSNVINNTNMYDTLEVIKNEPTYDSAEISFYGQETLTDQLLFADDNGTSSATYPYGNIAVSPAGYYPENTNSTTLSSGYYNIDFSDGRKTEDIVSVVNTYLDTEYYGYDLFVQNIIEVPNTATRQEPIMGWVKVDSYNIWTWFKSLPNWVNGTNLRGTYLGYKCRGFLCLKNGHEWRIDVYAWSVTGYQTVPVGGTITVDESYTQYIPTDNTVTQELVSQALSFQLRIHNINILYPVYIRKLHIRGDVVLRTTLNIARDNYSANSEKMFSYMAKYIYTTPVAEQLADAIYHYYQDSSYTFTCKSFADYPIGTWLLLTDNNFQNVYEFPVENIRCLVVGKKVNEFTGEMSYTLEKYADYEV